MKISNNNNNWEWPEYWEESGRLEETWGHLNSSERSSANADVKNSLIVNNNNEYENTKTIVEYENK